MKHWIPLFAMTPLLALSGCNKDETIGDAWLLQIGGGGPELVYDIVETADGRICSTGSFWATVTFGTGEQSRTLSTDGTQDIFVACYEQATGGLSSVTQFGTHRSDDVRGDANAFLLALDDNAKLREVRTVGGIGVEMGFAVTSLEQGGFAVAGVFNERLDPRIASVEPLANRGKSDVFLLRVGRPAGP